jgi:membrane protein DedA with SNARE-associated domain
MIHELLHSLITIWFGWVEAWGYAGVFILMAMESSIFPVPSEIVMPPAAFWAVQGQGKMSFAGVVLAGTAGSYFGSIVTYWASRWLGVPFIAKYGHYVGITPQKLRLAEGWVKSYGATGIFLARFLPVVRHLISIPAGICKMPVATFSLTTTVGAGLWCWVLAWFGAEVIGASPELLQSPEAMIAVIKAKLGWLVAGVGVLTVLYVGVLWQKKRANRAPLVTL